MRKAKLTLFMSVNSTLYEHLHDIAARVGVSEGWLAKLLLRKGIMELLVAEHDLKSLKKKFANLEKKYGLLEK